MKKFIFTILLTSSTVLFARSEEPKIKIDFPKGKTVLVAKKNFNGEKIEKVINQEEKKAMNLEGCIAIASYVGSYDPALGAAMMGDCAHQYNP
ncbi:hypothetical protein IQ37_02215 [Chryseobacterium piperi]|uniref:Uncharacterized protein n=1 Tax=Chryseobacterium piperi TaxID=558152 RepID=A0A086BM44_9FLAO|nr:hypothetical protein [Chryseobacterium piperi]ASW75374.1 hypothetical protein CJF12_14485 [Chryseobacterium piperi]KFF30008.1 hypothetical protein IQ37_02215 [Chryseobacterium piperi]